MSEPSLVADLIPGALEAPPEKQKRLMPEIAPPQRFSALVPKRFAHVTLETYLTETDSERYALRAVRRWVELVLAGDGPMLALIGPQGTGKSHLLYGAYWALDASHRRPSPFSWYRLADELRYGGTNPYNRAHLEAFEVRDRLWGAQVMLIDEVRPTANTNFDDTELAKVACHCYDAEIPVLITSNVSPLSDVLGGPAASRFTQVIVTGRDRRQTK
jgi:chromosomal replication initiation ATPase DnaA